MEACTLGGSELGLEMHHLFFGDLQRCFTAVGNLFVTVTGAGVIQGARLG